MVWHASATTVRRGSRTTKGTCFAQCIGGVFDRQKCWHVEYSARWGVVMNIDDAIDSAVDFLRRHQLPHGEFKTLLAQHRNMSNPVFDSSPFVTSFVLYAFSHLDRASINEMASKALAFLRAEMEFGGVWRYWSSRQQKHARLPP